MDAMTWLAAFLGLGWLVYSQIIKNKMNSQQNYIKQLETEIAELKKAGKK